jgi:hypothetical protein
MCAVELPSPWRNRLWAGTAIIQSKENIVDNVGVGGLR